MIFKYLLVCFSLLKLIFGDKSFTIVLDTSRSMTEELDVIKVMLSSVLNPLGNTDIRNYILVPFSDPGKKITYKYIRY